MAVQPAYRDAQRTNDSPRSVRIYKDLNLNFGIHPVTKQINTLTDAAAVKRSVRNLVQYGFYEKPFHPEIGSGVRDLLFENMTPFVANNLSKQIEEIITNYEPRVDLRRVKVTPDYSKNELNVTIVYTIIGVDTPPQQLDFALLPTR